GLAGVAAEQSIVLAVAGIQYGQRRGDVAACAASLLLLHGLALLAGLSAFRRLVHGMGPFLVWRCTKLDSARSFLNPREFEQIGNPKSSMNSSQRALTPRYLVESGSPRCDLGWPYRHGITQLLASAGLATIHARMAALQPKRWRGWARRRG